ncbi:tRNA 2-selenouridine(34) synthase MnmH [Tissierella creatinini]|nr:tRNA 2-selenouridine(34) synthase MnmH [Tissierella creatinini]TJX61518.1 tRNA 2-selenouridine(34) synthase MnmH [Soehngenia saccharolytica]
MLRELNYKDLENGSLDGTYLLIDVRSPGEFASETIPGAINIPIFTDEERAIIGTTYVQESMDEAKQLGVEAISRRLPDIFKQVNELDKEYKNLVFFCARGGFRSRSLVVLFKSLGINAIRLEGGYKGYRGYVNASLPKIVEEVQFKVLYGNTGCGKTEVLMELKKQGYDILDLEGCANHRGSLLGGVGLGTPHTQKMFESLVYHSLKNRKSNVVFTEGESKRIGRVAMPEYLFHAVKSGENIEIKCEIDLRIENILKDYINDTDYEILHALSFLKKHIGEKNFEEYSELIKKHDYIPVVKDLMIKYYDPKYEFKNREYIGSFENRDAKTTAKEIINFTFVE